MCKALRSAGVSPLILSLGRGGQKGSWRFHRATARRIQGIPVLYAPFLDAPLLTHVVTMFGLLPLIWRLRRRSAGSTLLAYNRLPFYWLGLEWARLLGFRLFMDLEDGMIKGEGSLPRQWLVRAMRHVFDRLCCHGAILASSSLARQYRGSNTLCCYGVSSALRTTFPADAELGAPLVFHMGGTLQSTTGTRWLVDTIKALRKMETPPNVRFVITGAGPNASELEALTREPGGPEVLFLGKVPRAQYERVMQGAHVGLSLRLRSSEYSDTTFPSKVIDIASRGLVLLSTDVSDIRLLFHTDGAVYLQEESVEVLAGLIVKLDNERASLRCMAERGQRYVLEACELGAVGRQLRAFLFDNPLSP